MKNSRFYRTSDLDFLKKNIGWSEDTKCGYFKCQAQGFLQTNMSKKQNDWPNEQLKKQCNYCLLYERDKELFFKNCKQNLSIKQNLNIKQNLYSIYFNRQLSMFWFCGFSCAKNQHIFGVKKLKAVAGED